MESSGFVGIQLQAIDAVPAGPGCSKVNGQQHRGYNMY
jgi:hypothetical protein